MTSANTKHQLQQIYPSGAEDKQPDDEMNVLNRNQQTGDRVEYTVDAVETMTVPGDTSENGRKSVKPCEEE